MNIDANILKYMTVDRLRQRITIQTPSVARDEEGNRIVTYTDADTVWAAVETVTSGSAAAAVEEQWEIRYRVVLRYGIPVQQLDRLLYRGRLLCITSPPVDAGGCHQWTVLECREWVET